MGREFVGFIARADRHQDRRSDDNLWTSDQLYKFDPSANKWTTFELPVHGTEIRHISLLERDGKLQVIVPVYRSSQMGVMTVRGQADVAPPKGAGEITCLPSEPSAAMARSPFIAPIRVVRTSLENSR